MSACKGLFSGDIRLFRKKRNFCCSSGKYTSGSSHSRWADSKVLTTLCADFNQFPQLHPCALFPAVPSTPNTEFLRSSFLFPFHVYSFKKCIKISCLTETPSVVLLMVVGLYLIYFFTVILAGCLEEAVIELILGSPQAIYFSECCHKVLVFLWK